MRPLVMLATRTLRSDTPADVSDAALTRIYSNRYKRRHLRNSLGQKLAGYYRDALHAAISSGTPQAISRPPLWPPSGPRSMT